MGNITLTGTGVGSSPAIGTDDYGNPSTNNHVTAAHGNITVNADSLDLTSNGSSVNFSTPGTVTFALVTAVDSISVANGGPGSLSLTAALLNNVSAGNITVGSTSDRGLLSIRGYHWNSKVTFLNGFGTIRLNGVTSTAANDGITIATLNGNFINTAGSGALAPGAGGRWLIFSQNAAHDTLGGLHNDFTVYNCTYGSSCNIPSTGNGLIYSQPQGLSLNLLNESSLLMPYEKADDDSSDSSRI